MIRIATVDRERFTRECGELWDLANAAFRPQLVIGIRSGGWWVAEAMQSARAPNGVEFLPLTCRRPSSAVKGESTAFKWLLKTLPYFVLNGMRLAEYYLLTLPRCRAARKHGAGVLKVADPAELTAIRDAIARLPADVRTLVVDDSLDSGATFVSVTRQLRELLPANAELRIAAFTVLGPDPIVSADFSLYQRVNCRFPWSYDFHG